MVVIDFWIIYLQSAYQGIGFDPTTRRGDGDSDSEIPTSVGGTASGYVGQGAIGAYSFVEVSRDRDLKGYTRAKSRTLVHESGHEWALKDCYPVTNPNQPPQTPCPITDDLMGGGLNGPNPKFSPKDLNIIRKSVKGTGK